MKNSMPFLSQFMNNFLHLGSGWSMDTLWLWANEFLAAELRSPISGLSVFQTISLAIAVLSAGCILSLVQTRSGTMMDNTVGLYLLAFYHILISKIQGLIWWKIVIHAFIDGFSRFLLGIRASSNNRATTVLDLFEDIVEVFGFNISN
jgi:hypothetical protein